MTTIASNEFKDEKAPYPTPCLSLVLSLSHDFLHRKGHGTEHNNTVKVGVVLDLDTWVGKMGLSCISMALSDFYASHGHYKPGWLQKSEIPKEMLLVQLQQVLSLRSSSLSVKLISLNNFRSQAIWVSRKFAGLISLRTNKLN
ncbi:hypothetical protein CK203_057326 [Vitis vinifera]|uniref:Uncharacterized protein n=1 Tax=Vitis vinifera TaxID=29760 RepID=A0A438GKR4_VITVI|nr:hypothetical protein CK203_057326 [Vitis vinifera]